MYFSVNRKKRTVGIDPGDTLCGIVILDDRQIVKAFNLRHPQFWSEITHFLIHPNCTIVFEDIKPYSMLLTPQVIDTCKFIGEAVFRIRNNCNVTVELVSRSEVKKWVFDTFPQICIEKVNKKLDKKIFLSCDIKTREILMLDAKGRPKRKPSFIHVDDRIVTAAMKELYEIPMPPPGQGYKFGLKDHSWQALAAASWFIHKEQK